MGEAAARLLALALLAGAAALVALGIAAPLAARMEGLVERREEATRQGDAFAERLAGTPEAAATLPDGLVHDAASPALLSAEMQRRAARAAQAQGGDVLSTAALEPEEADGALLVAVRLDADLTVAALAGLLHDLETTLPVLHVDALELRRDGRPEPGEAARLSARLTLSAYLDARGAPDGG